jgi:hypothetical protein
MSESLIKAMKYWPRNREACANCGCDSSRRDYGGSGYCRRCYRLIQRIKEIKSQQYREAVQRTERLTDEEVEIWQNECIRQLEGHLAGLRYREDKYRGNVEGMDIERQLGRILHLIRPRERYPTYASIIDRHFDKEQLGLIYRLLDVIEEAVPWEGPGRYKTVQKWRARDKIHEHRKHNRTQGFA